MLQGGEQNWGFILQLSDASRFGDGDGAAWLMLGQYLPQNVF